MALVSDHASLLSSLIAGALFMLALFLLLPLSLVLDGEGFVVVRPLTLRRNRRIPWRKIERFRERSVSGYPFAAYDFVSDEQRLFRVASLGDGRIPARFALSRDSRNLTSRELATLLEDVRRAMMGEPATLSA